MEVNKKFIIFLSKRVVPETGLEPARDSRPTGFLVPRARFELAIDSISSTRLTTWLSRQVQGVYLFHHSGIEEFLPHFL